MHNTDVWPIIEDVIGSLFDSYAPAMDRAADEIGLQSIGWQGWLLPALVFEPNPISTDRLCVRAAYTAPGVFAERLVNAARLGFLLQVAEGEYRLTEAGHRAAQHVLEAADVTMTSLRPMLVNDLERLAVLLLRIVEACFAAPEPPGKWCIEHSRRTDRGYRASALARIDQYLGDLNAYRDDAHLAAWQPHGFNGSVWEAFTYLWRGDAASLDDVCQKLERRGHARSVYVDALQDLIERGLIEEKDGKYQLTSQGSIFRQEVEDTTNRYFYALWTCLSEDETGELRTLLVQLRDGLYQLNS
jgi:Mn-dependent DtxR family transcriptional regulator